MAKNLKQLCAGVAAAVVLSGAGAYFINKWLEEDSKKKKEHETEQVVKDMSAQGISVYKKGEKNAPDSILTSVNTTHDMWTHSEIYSNPKYEKIGSKKPNTVRLGKEVKEWITDAKDKETMRIVAEKIKELTKNGATGDSIKSVLEEIAKQRPMHAPVEQTTQNFEYEEFDRDFKNIEKDGFWSVTSKDAEAKHEQAIYDDGSKKIEFENYTFPDAMPSDENIGQKEQRTPQPEAPKRKMNRDALPGRNLAQIKANKKQNG